jgi:tRNA (guanine9-N1)-methyltransferase
MAEEERPRKLQKIDDGSAKEPMEQGGSTGAAVSLADSPSDSHREEKDSGQDDNVDAATTAGEPSTSGLSKNQQKKLLKKQQWEAGREWRRAQRREKQRLKKKRDKEAMKAAQAQAAASTEGNGGETKKAADKPLRKDARTRKARERSVLLPVTFVLDCDFDDLMHEKERISLGAQLTRCYADNAKAPYRAHLVIASFNKLLKERFETALQNHHKSWKGVTMTSDDFVTAAEAAQTRMQSPNGGKMAGAFANQAEPSSPEQGEIIYLTSDSAETLTELKPYHTYIIGGLVDKNRHKGICYRRATERGIKTARLPIGEYLQMASRQVLATNHVSEIMLRWLELGDWGQAFSLVMPKRKGAKLRDNSEDAEMNGQMGEEAVEQEGPDAEQADPSTVQVPALSE